MCNLKPTINILTRLIFQFVVVIGMLSPVKSEAQIAFSVGGNYSNVRNEVLLKNKEPIFVSNLGVSVQYHPIKRFEKLSVINELNISQKGYQQNLDKGYAFEFNYLAFPVLVDYRLFKPLSVQGGCELSKLLSTSMAEGIHTYNNFDAGLVLGLSFHASRIVSFYARGIYGLVPMLDYCTFDELGNFTGKIHDLKNMCLSVGIKINIFNEKFGSYKQDNHWIGCDNFYILPRPVGSRPYRSSTSKIY